jgi:chlorite dismutase
MNSRTVELPDIREKGGEVNGERQVSERRLYMQLAAFTGCRDCAPLIQAVQGAGIQAVLYRELNDTEGVALLTMHEDPSFFVADLRNVLNGKEFSSLIPKPEFAMFGRSYSIGYERDLEDWLLKRPRRTTLNPEWPWAVWYPLKRSGEFYQLPEKEQMSILGEHGSIGRAFGEADYVHDVRLACFGLDKNDNDFLLGLIGKDLHPLSAIVQAMRPTKQTSRYMKQMGPFFVGKAAWQSEYKE